MLNPIFEENLNHTTYINEKGIIVPSVTTIIKMINKEELLYWANSLGFKRKSVTNELKVSANIGSYAHSMIETYLNTKTYDLDEIIENGPVERLCIKNCFLSFLKFFVKNKDKIEVINTEMQLSGKRFGGTLDLLAMVDGKLTLCDYKTGKKIYFSMFLQMAGYDILLRELYGKKVDQYMVIRLDKKDGKEAEIKIIADKAEMKAYRLCFKKLVLFYRDYIAINQIYWDK